LRDLLVLGGILALPYAGFCVLALCQDCHWTAATGGKPVTRPHWLALILAALLIAGGLTLSIYRDGIVLGLIFWVTVLSASALAVTFTLSWRAEWLRSLAYAVRWRRGTAAQGGGTVKPNAHD